MKKLLNMCFLVITLCFFSICSYAYSENVRSITPYVSVYIDDTGEKTVNQIRNFDFRANYKHLNFGFTSSAVWLKLKLPAAEFSGQQWLLDIGIPYPDRMDIYQKTRDGFVHYEKGLHKSQQTEPYPHRDSVIPIQFSDQESIIYIRLSSLDGMAVNAKLITEDEFRNFDRLSQLFFGGYFGIMLAMAVYNFFLFLSLRDSRYIFYVVFTLAVTLNVSTHYNFLHQYLSFGNAWLSARLTMLTFCFAIIASIQFVRSFLSTPSDMKKLDIVFKIFLIIYAGIILYTLAAKHPGSAVIFINLLPLLSVIALAGIQGLHKRRDPASTYFLIAFGVFITGVGLFTLRRFGLLAPSPSVNFTFMIGSIFETMLLSFALANQINTLRQQNEAAQNQLILRMQEYNASLEKMKESLEETVLIRTSNLQKSLKEKDVLLKEVHHRVKNNLSVIASLLGFQIMNESKDNLSATEALRAGRSRIESMALVHDLLCKSSYVSEINIEEYFSNLLENLHKSYGKNNIDIKINCDSLNLSLQLDVLVACGLIVNELVTNSIKHAFGSRHDGVIEVSMKYINGDIELKVTDNGIGIKEKTPENLGMKLVKLMTEQLNGKLELHSNNGSQWLIYFPYVEERYD